MEKTIRLFNRYWLYTLLIIELFVASNVKWGGERWKQIVAADGKGYYAYLPAVFIYHDYQFSFHGQIEDKYSSDRERYEYRRLSGNGVVDKYYAGTAVIISPFFFAAHLISKITGQPADGYSWYYQIFVSIACIAYGGLGLFFLGKLLRLYNIRETIISLTLLTIAIATPFFNYMVFEPSLSHIYSFTCITIFIYYLKIYISKPGKKLLILLATLYGLIILLRPVNGLIILSLPFIAGSVENLKRLFKSALKSPATLVISAILFIAIISIQLVLYYASTGNFFVYSYVGERMIWDRPEIINILFSYKKGLFVYAPVVFISMFGLISIYRKNRFAAISFLLFFLILTYVLSCWWTWWYGGSFGSRPYIEYYSFFAILLAMLFMHIKRRALKSVLSVIIFFCFFLCQIQIYQYRYYFLHWEKMDKEHYWRIFMRLDQLANKEKNGNPNADLLK